MFTVRWAPEAIQELADIWAGANDRNAVTDAVDAIDRALGRDPEDQGESRDEGRRILIELPLGIMFRVSPLDRKVLVLTVWPIGRHRQGP